MKPAVRRNLSPAVSLTAALAALVGLIGETARGQASIRSRDQAADWSAPTLNSAADAAYVPSWNAQPNAWRLGVAIENVDVGVRLTDVEAGMPAQKAGLERGDIIVNVEGYQVGYVNGSLFDLGDEMRRRVDSQGRINFLVYDQRDRRLVSLPVALVQQSAGGVRGEVICKERITLTQQAVLTVRLRDVTYPNWQNVEVGKHVIPAPPHPPIPFSIQFDRSQLYPDHRYEVDAYLFDRGQVVLQSKAGVPVTPLANNNPLQVTLVRPASAPSPGANTYAVGQLDQITQWYRQYLRREPTVPELSAWQAYLQSGKSPQDVLAYILGSSEYFDRMDNQRDSYLAELYRSVMGRQPTASELQQFTTQYQQYGGARTDFVRDVLRLQPSGL
ncbi:MAG: YbaY family lipoprotein [Pirellulales bacterium]|nr:YbaY family lipoprotein [Pirellulales bacterium]